MAHAASTESHIGKITRETRAWLEAFVVGLNLCPFARSELQQDRVRIVVSAATDDSELLERMGAEIQLLDETPSVATTLIVHPAVLIDFHDYHQFLPRANRLLKSQGWKGVFQIATFHPDYQFASTEQNDTENYTNRSPYPMIHILREASLERAIDSYPEVDDIPARNIALMNDMGHDKLRKLWRSCFDIE